MATIVRTVAFNSFEFSFKIVNSSARWREYRDVIINAQRSALFNGFQLFYITRLDGLLGRERVDCDGVRRAYKSIVL